MPPSGKDLEKDAAFSKMFFPQNLSFKMTNCCFTLMLQRLLDFKSHVFRLKLFLYCQMSNVTRQLH